MPIGTDFLPHTVTVFPSELFTDERGNQVRRPSSTGTEVAAFIQSRSSNENVNDGQAVQSTFTAYLEAAAPVLDAQSRIEWGSRSYETVGDALPAHDRLSAHHQRVVLRRIGA